MTDDSETVVEVVVRSMGSRKGVDRELAGWRESTGACRLEELTSLMPCFVKQDPPLEDVRQVGNPRICPATLFDVVHFQIPSDPRQNLPFKLSLTTEQQESRAQVPLPYAHTGVYTFLASVSQRDLTSNIS